MMEIPKLEVDFRKFMFFNEIKALKGLDYLLKEVHFGNTIKITMKEMTLSMFKNDFFFFMTVLFNNISFDDERDKFFMEGFEQLDYASPMNMDVDISKMQIEFRYEKPNQNKRNYVVFEMPEFSVSMKKNIKNEKKINITSE